MLDEMYIEKCEEYDSGKLIGADDENQLYKGVVSFMVVGLKETVSYVVKSVPEVSIDANFLQHHILDCLRILNESEFNVRAVVSDNHSTNVSGYSKLLKWSSQPSDSTFMMYESKKIYLFHDTVHIMKNIRNNFLNCKRFLFPSFKFCYVTGGSLHWKTLHDVYERDQLLQSHLRKAKKLTGKVLHPGSNKQSVPLTLAVFDETTSAAIHDYFPERKDSAEFLQLFHK